MSIDKRLRDSFSEITPPTDNVTLVRNVIERAENMNKNENESRKPRLNRAAVIIIAAAAVLTAATVSVGAANGWSFNRAFEQANQTIADHNGNHAVTVYSTAEAGQNAESAETAVSAEPAKLSEPFDYLSGGKELDLWYSFDNFKLNIKGICADDFSAYVLYDIIFNEDFDYSSKAGWTEWEVYCLAEAVDNTLDEQPELGMVGMQSDGIISREDNILHCYAKPGMFPQYTWSGKTMTLDFMNVGRYVPTRSEKEDDPYYDVEELSFGENGLHVEIPIDFKTFESTTWEINKPIDLAANDINRKWYGDDLPGTVRYFRASPLSFQVYVEADTSDFVKGDCYTFDLTCNIGEEKVTRVIGEGYMWDDDNGQGDVGLFSQPIDPAEISSITICGQTYELG